MTEITTVEKTPLNKRASSFIFKYWLGVLTILVFVVFTIMEPRFASLRNVMNILSSTCTLGLVGIGVTIVFCCGEIDFSCGMELSAAAVMMAIVLDKKAFSNHYILVLGMTLIMLVLYGILNVFLHVTIGIPSFIATMGTSLIATGICKYLTNSGSIYSKRWPAIFTYLGQGYVFKVIPVSVIILIIVGTIMWIYTEKTKNGKLLYAVGSNTTACKYVGISVKQQKIKAFIICSVLCGLAGIIQSSQLNSANPYMGDVSLINALTVLMLGATFLRIGVFNIPGTLVASLLFQIISFGLVIVDAPGFLKDFIQGGILLFALSFVTLVKKRQNKSLG